MLNSIFAKNTRILLLLICIFMYPAVKAGDNSKQCDYLIDQGIAAMQEKKYSKSIELLTKARAYAEKHHLDKQQFLSIMYIGYNYQGMLEYGEAMEYFLEGYAIAIKLEPKAETMAIHNIANLYVLEEDYKKAQEYFQKAYEIAKKHKVGDKFTGMTLSGLAFTLMENGDLALSRKYLLKSLEYLKNWPKETQTVTIILIKNTLQSGKPQEAREKALELYHSSSNLDYDHAGVNLQFIIARSYLAQGDFLNAIVTARKILASKPELNSKNEAYVLLAEAYAKQNNLKAALQYKDSVFDTQQELNAIKNGRLFESNKVKFEVAQYKGEIVANEEKLKHERLLLYFVGAIALATIIIGFLVFKQRGLLAARKRHLIQLDLEKEKNNSLILEQQVLGGLQEQERLKNEVDVRNRKLSAKALHLSGRNELIEEILEYLSKRPKYLKDTTLAAYVHSLKQHLRTDNDWDDFIAHFEEVNAGFLNRLKTAHPSLTVNDIRFVAYMYMNLSTKEIAYILNITTLASKKRKERLAAKMEISKEQDIYDYIATL